MDNGLGFMANYGVNNSLGVPGMQTQAPGSGFLDMGQYGGGYSGQGGGGTNWQGLFGNIGSGLQAFSSLANLYGGFKMLSLANKDFKMRKKSTILGANNQAQAYNNTLKDRWQANANIASRGGNSPLESMSAYMDDRKVSGWT